MRHPESGVCNDCVGTIAEPGLARRRPRWPKLFYGRAAVKETGLRNSACGVEQFGFSDLAAVHWNLVEAPLYEHALANGEAQLVEGGALCAETGIHTGRSPKDKFVVCDE